MNDRAEPALTIRTAAAADLPALRQIFRAASLSNAADAPMLLARPEFLIFAGDGIATDRTRVVVASPQGEGRVVGFVTVAVGDDGPELEDLFVDPDWRRRGVACRLVLDVVRTVRQTGYRHLWVTGNPYASDFYLAVGVVETGRVATELGAGLRMYLDLTRN
jgi:N-acetylglutamate synthase-like GNAT family acetyltransferase